MYRELEKNIVLLALAVAIMPVFTGAQNTQQPSQAVTKPKPSKQEQKMAQGSGNLSTQDRDFVMKVAEGGQMEVMMAEMGVSKAASADVKQFAQRLVDDHTKANEELKSLATSKGITLPMENAVKSQKMKAEMEKPSAAAFDREFMKHMIKDHEKDIAMFERQARAGKDGELKSWAEKTLPTLREHLQMAREVAGKVGGTGTGMNNNKMNKGTKETTAKPPQR